MGIDNIQALFSPDGESPREPLKPVAQWTDQELLSYLTSPQWRKYNENFYVTVAAQATARGLTWEEDLLL
jgi:hypothetical protein